MLAPVLDEADRVGIACCLETSTVVNRRFYEQRGFEGAEELQPAHNTDALLAAAIGSLLGRTRERLSRMARLRSAAGRALRSSSLSVSWEEVSLSVSFGSEREEDLARELFATVALALAKGRAGVVLLLDEAQLTPAEQDLLLASAKCPYPPLRSADLAGASAKTPGNVNVLLGRLVYAGALYRIRKGEYAYTAPKFRDYLARTSSAPRLRVEGFCDDG